MRFEQDDIICLEGTLELNKDGCGGRYIATLKDVCLLSHRRWKRK
jgi:hypothetical protein